MDVLEIPLEGKAYRVRQLTIGQLRDLQIGVAANLANANPVETLTSYWARNIAVISTALSADYPELTPEAVMKMRLGTRDAVDKVVQDILTFAGLAPKAKTAGEAPAGAP